MKTYTAVINSEETCHHTPYDKIDQLKNQKKRNFDGNFWKTKSIKRLTIWTSMYKWAPQASIHPPPRLHLNKVAVKGLSLYNQLLLFGRVSLESVKLKIITHTILIICKILLINLIFKSTVCLFLSFSASFLTNNSKTHNFG